jgi:branched-chain amino acid transport system substrate-binding protein
VRKRLFAGLALSLALVLVAGACSSKKEPGSNASKPTLTLTYMGALTGDLAQLVIPGRNAAELAIEQQNAKGDLPVVLKLDPQNTGADKNKAATIAQGLKDKLDLLAVLGPAFSGESQTTGAVLDPAGILRVTGSATNPPLADNKWKYWFRGLGNDTSQGGAVDDVILKVLKKKSIYIGHDKTQYGEGLATIVRDNLKAAGGTVVGFEAQDPGKKDYSPLTSKVTAAKSDVFYWGGYSPELILITKSLREKGYKGTIMGADGSKDDSYLKGAGAAAQGAYLTCPCADPNVSTESTTKAFVTAFKAKYTAEPGIYAAEYYDMVGLIADAIRKVGATGDISTAAGMKVYRDKIRDAIASTSYQGISKKFGFQPNGELVASAVETYLYQVEGGKYKTLGKVTDIAK